MYNFDKNSLLNWITAFCIFEVPIALFYLSISGKNDIVTNWYSGKDISIYNVILQDSLYVICGIIIALRIFNYMVNKKKIKKRFINLLLILIGVQLVGDLTFSLIIRSWPRKYSNTWINYFKNYISKSGFNALFGDTIYIVSWACVYYFVSKYIKKFDIKIFIICLFFFCLSAYSIR